MKENNQSDINMMIQINNEGEIMHWCNELECERDDLIHALINVGNSFNAVNDFLIMNHKKTTH